MKIIIKLTEDDFPENEIDMIIEETEVEDYKWITIDGKKYSILTKDLVFLSKLNS